MSLPPAPKIDSRTAADIAKQIRQLLTKYVSGWETIPPDTLATKGVSAALIGIAARFAELLIQRLNRVPDKNFLAFLDLLGAALLPPRPARVPLTFMLADGSLEDALVPAGTQVAAQPAPGEQEPVVYETEKDLVVVATKLALALIRDPEMDTYDDYSNNLLKDASAGTVSFQGERKIAHILYLGSDLLNAPGIENFGLTFNLQQAAGDELSLKWEISNGDRWQDVTPTPDGTESSDSPSKPGSLRQTGTITFDKIPASRPTMVHEIKKEWIRCCLLTPITPSTDQRSGMIRAGQLPDINSVKMSARLQKDGLPMDEAYSSVSGPVDLGYAFYPFGEKPKLNDTLWLALEEAFGLGGATVTLDITVTTEPPTQPTTDPDSRTPPAAIPSSDLKLKWETWTGTTWVELGTAGVPSAQDPGKGLYKEGDFTDSTNRLSNTGYVKFKLPPNVARYSLNGKEKFWVRVKIVKGGYGLEGHFTKKKPDDWPAEAPPTLYYFIPPAFKSPSISSLSAKYTLDKTEVLPEKILSENDFRFTDLTGRNNVPNQTFVPFCPTKDLHPALYLGFHLPKERERFPNALTTMSFLAGQRLDTQPAANSGGRVASAGPPELVWEYWNGDWTALAVRDETRDLTTTGLVEFLAPPDFAPHSEFGMEVCWWLRVRWGGETGPPESPIQRIFLNTVMAEQSITVRDEILGSSDGSANQRFKTTRAPVLDDQILAVREVSIKTDSTEKPSEIWVTWHEVQDFYPSDAQSRHYTLDHVSGEVCFGDGWSGMIPPVGSANIRLNLYKTGGGKRGNKSPNSVTQLTTTIPFIDRVTNFVEASGGSDMETNEALTSRMPTQLRHRDRAVTLEDYQDLAKAASTDVARALCLPIRDLTKIPSADKEFGKVSLIIVPDTTDQKPQPSVELIRRVQSFISSRCPVNATVLVVGPSFVQVNVQAEIAVASMDKAREAVVKVRQALSGFLHPLTGGFDRKGWEFGREPHRSDLYQLIDGIPEVDHVHTLTVQTTEEPAGSRKTGGHLVYSGTHIIDVVYDKN